VVGAWEIGRVGVGSSIPKVAGNGKGEGKGEVAHETRCPISWCLTQFL